ncbi:MAG: hypothetical protein JXR46_02150 [Calditrichaceae bacterium]|nr:hypothetical protein [Calditrichaceae bacterium]MBN2707823.1 hypothetical protein [Calditrichaceae bacterium]RQV94890.1 MAG: hypothetical protein EH224_09000 [Calditrichota bacterium]
MILRNPDLKKYLAVHLKNDLKDFLSASPEPTAIRINPLRTSFEDQINRLKSWKIDFSKIPFSDHGLIVNHDRMPLSQTLDFFRGFFHYQGISSQLRRLFLIRYREKPFLIWPLRRVPNPRRWRP